MLEVSSAYLFRTVPAIDGRPARTELYTGSGYTGIFAEHIAGGFVTGRVIYDPAGNCEHFDREVPTLGDAKARLLTMYNNDWHPTPELARPRARRQDLAAISND